MEKLLLIHGALGSASQLEVLKKGMDQEFDVHLLEFDGHGVSSGNSNPFTTEGFLFQLNDALSSLGSSVHIFGYSMGGFIALLSAVGNKGGIKSVTTLGTKMRWTPEIAELEAGRLNPEIIKEKVPVFAQALEIQHGVHWDSLLIRTANYMKKLGEEAPITKEAMNQLGIPVQLCLGAQDQMVSIEETHEVHQWIDGSKMVVIPESKHPLEQTNLTALADTIRSFIKRNS